MKFTELNLMPEILSAINDMGFSEMTSIQENAIPLVKTGVDIIGKSQTGTGKTLAFAIPAIEMLEIDAWNPSVQVLVVCPTRELAMQGCAQFNLLTKYLPKIRTCDIYGGVPMTRQIEHLKRASIVIGTPGRIMDHMRRGTLNLKNVKMVVLDEADEMLSMGFKEDIENILMDIPPERQTVMFSATMPPEIMKITEEFLKNPSMVEIDKAKVTLDNIEQMYVEVPMGRKMDALCLLLKYYDPALSMVFCNTKKMVDDVTNYLISNGIYADALHGDLNQGQRTKVMNSFKHGNSSVLVATDVAARGIDVSGVDFVFNYDIPQENEYYIHRIGRTGRAGKSGKAITICSGRKQVINLSNIAYFAKSEISEIFVPTTDEIKGKILERSVDELENILKGEIEERYLDVFEKIAERGYSYAEIAAAAIKLHYNEIELNISDVTNDRKEKNTVLKAESSEKITDYINILLSIGRNSRVAPNHIVAAITERTSLVGREIGKIEIYDNETTVGIPADRIDEVLEDLISLKICGKPVSVSLAVYMGDKKKSNRKKESGRNENKREPKKDYRRLDKKRKPENKKGGHHQRGRRR